MNVTKEKLKYLTRIESPSYVNILEFIRLFSGTSARWWNGSLIPSFPPWWHWFNSNKHNNYLCEKSMYQLRGFCTWVGTKSAILKLIRKSLAFTCHSSSHWLSGTWFTGKKNLSSWLLGEEKEKLEYKSNVKIFRGAAWGTCFYLGWISSLTRQGIRVRAAENRQWLGLPCTHSP